MEADANHEAAKWLVGGRLASVLHLGDRTLAYLLAEQGHDVTVAAPDLTRRRHENISYVRASADHLPFCPRAFNVVAVADLGRLSSSSLADIARILTVDGLLTTAATHYDSSVPWMARVHEIVGYDDAAPAQLNRIAASGLFHPAEERDFTHWDKVDLPGLLAFAERLVGTDLTPDARERLTALFSSYGAQTGELRVQRRTRYVRVRVDKDALPADVEPDGLTIFELG